MGALLYGILAAWGSQIDQQGVTSPKATLIRFALISPAAFFVLLALFHIPTAKHARRPHIADDPAASLRRFRWIVVIVLLAAWMPMFLVQFPGSFMYDTQRQTFQIARGSYDAFHPLLHTLWLRACLALYPLTQSIERCAAIYSLTQMGFLAFCLSGVCAVLRRCFGKRAAVFSAFFFALYPSHMAMACNFIKDVPFAGCFALLLARCLEGLLLYDDKKGALRWRVVLLGMLCCLLRNNMIYALLVWALLLCLSRRTRRIGLCAVLSAVLALGANEAMIRGLHAARGSAAEMLSVPIQQLARVRLTAPEAFDDEQKALLDEVFPGESWANYEPTLSDPVKNLVDADALHAKRRELLSLWASISRRCPGVYLDAALALMLPSIYPYQRYAVAQPYIETGLQPGVLAAPFGQPPMQQPRRFAAIRTWLDRHIYATGADAVPVLHWLMNTGAVYWFLLFCLLRVIARGRRQCLAALLLPLLLYGTFLLGPVMQGRYLYPFICALPLFAACAFGALPDEENQ